MTFAREKIKEKVETGEEIEQKTKTPEIGLL